MTGSRCERGVEGVEEEGEGGTEEMEEVPIGRGVVEDGIERADEGAVDGAEEGTEGGSEEEEEVAIGLGATLIIVVFV